MRVIESKIDIEEREAGFRNALDLFMQEKLPLESGKALYNGCYKTLLIIFLSDLQDRKQKLLDEFKDKTSLSRGEWELLQKRIRDL
jgi:hypothetical protein